MRIAILCDGYTLLAWQRAALEAIARDEHTYHLLIAEDAPPRRRQWRHALYYLLNIFSVRNHATKKVPFPDAAFAAVPAHRFRPGVEGAWATLPNATLEWLERQGVEAIIKFGLDLLRIPPPERLAVPILSYHHGDPRRFRGRPAGFWEMLSNEATLGQIVQVLSNRLDAGTVLAYSESRVRAYSWRATLVAAFDLSPHLLREALRNLAAGRTLALDPTGRNYRLPGTWAVALLAGRMVRAFVQRIGYGALVEKRWRISSLETTSDDVVGICQQLELARVRWRDVPVDRRFTFLADPFFFGESALIAEGLDKRTGTGVLAMIEDGRTVALSGLKGHASYPGSVESEGRRYLLPEVASWSEPALFAVSDEGTLEQRQVLRVAGGAARLLDPTMLHHRGEWYLFANRAEEGADVLRLWRASRLDERFIEHPASPIRVSARGSRMAGALLYERGTLLRVGQDDRRRYGDGILLFRIEELGTDRYRETELETVAFTSVHGPHTFNRRGSELVFDWYVERWSLFAGVRRARARLARR